MSLVKVTIYGEKLHRTCGNGKHMYLTTGKKAHMLWRVRRVRIFCIYVTYSRVVGGKDGDKILTRK